MELPAGNLAVHGEGVASRFLGDCLDGQPVMASAVMCFPLQTAKVVPAARPRVAVAGQRELLAHNGADRVAFGPRGGLREVSAALHSDQAPGAETLFGARSCGWLQESKIGIWRLSPARPFPC